MTGLRLAWGGATDTGQIRQINQDRMLLGPAIFLVADGMGGHAAGEVASQITVDTIDDRVNDPDRDRRVLELVTAVQAANETVWDQAATDTSLAGMGTTVVAIARVIEDGEERLAIVNVGDSRAYRLSEGELFQISDDHSLVGELVREGRVTAEEARTHPRKNIITRAIGIDETVNVDEFQLLPRTGDRYLLCSDGLTDEVEDDAIATALRTITDPNAAAEDLVRQANENGGSDNITIVIVDVLDDGIGDVDPGRSGLVSAPVPDDDDFSAHPDEDTQTFLAVPDDMAHHPDHALRDPALRDSSRRERSDDTDPGTRDALAEGAALPAGARPPRAVTLRSLAFILAVLAAVGVFGLLGYNAVRNTYTVGVDKADRVAIFQGRPGGFLWFEPTFEESTDIAVDDLPGGVRDDIIAGVSQSSRASARLYIANLRDRIERLTPPVSTPSRTPSSTTTTSATGDTSGETTPTTRVTTTTTTVP